MPKKTGPNINNEIRADEIRVVGADGEMAGVMSVAEGVKLAEEAGLDLVEVSPNAKPPVCKFSITASINTNSRKKLRKLVKSKKLSISKKLKFALTLKTMTMV